MRTCLSILAVGLVLGGVSGCSTSQSSAARGTSATTAASDDGSVRFWAADSLGSVCFNRERTTYALLARARAREQTRDAVANVPTNAR